MTLSTLTKHEAEDPVRPARGAALRHRRRHDRPARGRDVRAPPARSPSRCSRARRDDLRRRRRWTSAAPRSTATDARRLGRAPTAGCRCPRSRPTTCWSSRPAPPTPRTGEGILRTVDPTDKLVYVWTSLEPDEARRVWACFDQPDLKAPHRFVVTAPSSWLVTSNGAPESVEDAGDRRRAGVDLPRHARACRRTSSWSTPARSTRCASSTTATTSGFYCRQSLVPILERDLDELVTLTRQGLAFFGERFGCPFPQERYDQVFVPNLGGAMENWGCVTYGDGQLFRTPPTHAQRARAGGVHLPRDGAHVVRRPGDHAVVGRPLAQRGLRLLGGQLGAWRAPREFTDAVGQLPGRLQAHRLRDGHEPGPPPDPRRRARRRRRRWPTSTRSPTSRARACSTSCRPTSARTRSSRACAPTSATTPSATPASTT